MNPVFEVASNLPVFVVVIGVKIQKRYNFEQLDIKSVQELVCILNNSFVSVSVWIRL